MSPPRVSVVTPAFDAGQTIGATVASVLGQTYRDLELVVVDDGSTDGTAAIVEAHGGPVRVVRQENRGVAAARNRGIEAAAGELIAFCDADDFLLPQHVERLVRVWDDHGGIATANSYWLLPGGIRRSKRRYRGGFPNPKGQRRAILEQNFVSPLSVFPRSLVEEIGAFDVERRRAEDWDFWLRAIFAGRRVTLQPEPTALYRWGTEGLSSAYEQMDAEVEAVLRTAAARDDLTPDERGYVERRLSGPGPRELARRGDRALRAARYSEAAHAYGEAARLVPSERMLLWKARVLRPAPRLTGPLVRARQLRIERSLGLTEEHVR
ncbi:MAG TPA: glycosyltransferase [Gaiellaceae bacterium]|nr:glycosyltransferase [Gaiellaceae bacterium]